MGVRPVGEPGGELREQVVESPVLARAEDREQRVLDAFDASVLVCGGCCAGERAGVLERLLLGAGGLAERQPAAPAAGRVGVDR